MKKYKWIIVLLNLVLLLIYFNHSIAKKEESLKQKELKDGQLVLLEIEHVVEGNVMFLRYKISENIDCDNMPKRGYCVVVLDQFNRANKVVRFQKDLAPLNKDEHLIEYTASEYTASDKWTIKIGAESSFFLEGQAEKYKKSKYGGVKIDKNGNCLLVGLYDEQLRKIE